MLGDVTVASESVGVVGCDTAAGSHATVQRAADDDHVTGIAARREPLVDAVLTCLKWRHRVPASNVSSADHDHYNATAAAWRWEAEFVEM